MGDGRDRRVVFHSAVFDPQGAGARSLQDGAPGRCPPEGFQAIGRAAEKSVPCPSADVQALGHVGYGPEDEDIHDMNLLAERFGIELPEPYRERA